jgi:type IV secretion system protein VirD4
VALTRDGSEEESQRPLLTPDEALRLPEDAALVFSAGNRPILAEKVRYYDDPRLLDRARIPAPALSDRIMLQHSLWPATSQSVLEAAGVLSTQQPSVKTAESKTSGEDLVAAAVAACNSEAAIGESATVSEAESAAEAGNESEDDL